MAADATTCDAREKDWEEKRKAAVSLQGPQLLLIWGTAALVLAAAVLLLIGQAPAGAVTAMVGVLTGAGAIGVTTALNNAQKRADSALNKYVKECSAHPEAGRRMGELLPD